MCNRMQSAILREMADILPKISADGRLFCSYPKNNTVYPFNYNRQTVFCQDLDNIKTALGQDSFS